MTWADNAGTGTIRTCRYMNLRVWNRGKKGIREQQNLNQETSQQDARSLRVSFPGKQVNCNRGALLWLIANAKNLTPESKSDSVVVEQ
jgi:hypothetical protein